MTTTYVVLGRNIRGTEFDKVKELQTNWQGTGVPQGGLDLAKLESSAAFWQLPYLEKLLVCCCCTCNGDRMNDV